MLTKEQAIKTLLQRGVLPTQEEVDQLLQKEIQKTQPITTTMPTPQTTHEDHPTPTVEVHKIDTDTGIAHQLPDTSRNPYAIGVEIHKIDQSTITDALITEIKTSEIRRTKVEALTQSVEQIRKLTPKDFIKLFRERYEYVKKLFLTRPNTANAISINKLEPGKDSYIIARIYDLEKLSNQTKVLTLADPSGEIKAYISDKNPQVQESSKNLTKDEVIALKGTSNGKTFRIEEIIFPDIKGKRLQNTDEDVYVAFVGDIHVGSKVFLQKQFQDLLDWLNGKKGTDEQKQIAKNLKYILISGDNVDGVGVYPEQNKELTIKSIEDQHETFARFIKQIPSDKEIIIIPGNHDGVRISEPQPPLPKEYGKSLYNIPNIHHHQNPSLLRLHRVDGYQGVDILLYHGYSFDYFIDSVESLQKDGYEAPQKVMRFLLQKRHLAPTYGSTLVLPRDQDELIIREEPNVFATGHIHKAGVASYKGVYLIANSTWQGRTVFQERVGHKPDPGILPLLNLKDGKVIQMNFMGE